jgi:exodeoxyribonuclease V beta subunit
LVLWWAPLSSKPNQALADLLANAVHAGAAGAVPIAVDDFAPLVRRAAGHLDVVPVGAGHAAVRAVPVDAPPAPLEVGTSSFRADPSWRRWSFSGIKSRSESSGSTAHDAPVAGGADEPSDVDPADVPAAIPPADAAHEPHPLANAPGGTDFGTLVHGVFERCDFASPTLAADLTELCADALRFRRLPIAAADLAAGLLHSIEAPLGGPQGDGRLRDLVRGDRLDEVAFDLCLGELRASEVGEVLAHHLPDHDLLAPWARRTASAGFDFRVAGMLNGSIDLVARTADGRQFWLADYKTNQLGAGSRYSPAELAAAMAHHHYPLQAALYLVALHRYLRWRLPDYLPDQHLAGAAYLFVRGMRPASSGHDAAGVFWWRPPTAAIEALDRLLAGGGVS